MKIGIIHRVPWLGKDWEEICPIGHSVLVLSKKNWWGDYLVQITEGGVTTYVDCSDIEILEL